MQINNVIDYKEIDGLLFSHFLCKTHMNEIERGMTVAYCQDILIVMIVISSVVLPPIYAAYER